MKMVVLCLLLMLAAAGSGAQNSFVTLPGETRLPLPTGWRVLGVADDFPVAVVEEETGAQLLVFRSELPAGDLIGGSGDFQVSVNSVIDSVVLQLPGAVLLTNTGSYEGNRAEFVVEFLANDEESLEPLRHRLGGVLYRHPDGYQMLFTLWGQSGEEVYGEVRKDLEAMQWGFRYVGPQEAAVFAPGGSNRQWVLVFLIGLAAVYFIVRQRRRLSSEGETSGRVPVWRCSCGRANHRDNAACRRCGKPRPEGSISGRSVPPVQ